MSGLMKCGSRQLNVTLEGTFIPITRFFIKKALILVTRTTHFTTSPYFQLLTKINKYYEPI